MRFNRQHVATNLNVMQNVGKAKAKRDMTLCKARKKGNKQVQELDNTKLVPPFGFASNADSSRRP